MSSFRRGVRSEVVSNTILPNLRKIFSGFPCVNALHSAAFPCLSIPAVFRISYFSQVRPFIIARVMVDVVDYTLRPRARHEQPRHSVRLVELRVDTDALIVAIFSRGGLFTDLG